MKRALLLLITIYANLLFAQPGNHKTMFDNFQTNYNNEKYIDIFNEFSPEMQSALPLEKTSQFFTNLKSQVGKIIDKEFVSNENEASAIYKTQFERAILGVYLTLNDKNKIAGLLIKPYKEPNNIETATVNNLKNYPNKIAKIIYSKAKNLPKNSQISIAIIDDGEVNYYGIKREEGSIDAVENQSKIFEIGSITKVFTATVLASLIEEEKIKLTDEINSLYSFDFNDNVKITFEDVANHTSGLPRLPDNLDLSNINNPYESYGKTEIEEYLKNTLKLNEDKTKSYTYSNLGAGLLGYTLGLSQNTSFRELLQKAILDKYNMNNSFTNSQNLEEQLIKGMDKEGTVVSNWDLNVLFGAGGLLSTTEDLVKFAEAQFNPANKENELTRKSTFKINENLEIGLGWHILKSEKSNDLYWHNGGTGGYSSSMTLDVTSKSAVIILSNVGDVNKAIDELGSELIDEIRK